MLTENRPEIGTHEVQLFWKQASLAAPASSPLWAGRASARRHAEVNNLPKAKLEPTSA